MKSVELIPIFSDNYVFLLKNKKNAVLVDPGSSDEVVAVIKEQNLSLQAVLLTHHHDDHIGGLSAFPNVEVYAPLVNKEQIPSAKNWLAGNEEVQVGGFTFSVLKLPGHTLGHLAFYEVNQQWLFSGDVIFGLGCGRIFEGTYVQQYESLQLIKKLPPDTLVFCAHEYTEVNLRFLQSLGTMNREQIIYAEELQRKRAAKRPSVPLVLKDELQANPFLLAPDLEQFTRLRLLRNDFK